jgi:DNA-binding LacI/PurR family transcriptional regulator
MKKILALLLAVLMAFALFGCAADNTANETTDNAGTATPDATGEETAAAEETVTIVYLCNSMTNVFCYNLSLGLEQLAPEYNYEVISGTYDGDGDKFVNLVETYIDQEVDGFILTAEKSIRLRSLTSLIRRYSMRQ